MIGGSGRCVVCVLLYVFYVYWFRLFVALLCDVGVVVCGLSVLTSLLWCVRSCGVSVWCVFV